MAILSAEQITSLVPLITEEWAELYRAAVESRLLALFGVSIPSEREADIRLICITAVQRHGLAKPWLSSEATGPYQAAYRDVGAQLFLASEVAELSAMVGGVTHQGPRGRFEAGSIDRIFAQRGQRWRRF